MGIPFLYSDHEVDVVHILQFCNDFVAGLGMERVDVDTAAITGILKGLRVDFHNGGAEKASAFKKAANFVTFFVAQKPIKTDLQNLCEELSKIRNYSNAVLAFEIAREALHGATIERNDGTTFTLVNRIEVSDHSYVDIIDALSDATPNVHFKMVTVLLEQLAYRANPDASYPIHSDGSASSKMNGHRRSAKAE